MKPHKHAEWVKKFVDGEEVQGFSTCTAKWIVISELGQFDHFGFSKFRIKPREFIEGRWYPVCFEGVKRVLLFSRNRFFGLNKMCGNTTIDQLD